MLVAKHKLLFAAASLVVAATATYKCYFAPRQFTVLIVQNNVQFAQVASNMHHVEQLIGNRKFDLLLLPELSFTGFEFSSKEQVEQIENNQATIAWCQTIAQQRNCHVIVGFPYFRGNKIYNAMIIVNRQGKVAKIYKKHHLFYMEKHWAEASEEGYSTMQIPELGKVGIAICNDINPPLEQWEEQVNQVESMHLAKFFAREQVRFVLFMANVHVYSDTFTPEQQQLHWLNRMAPLHGQNVTMFCANRVGKDLDKPYNGSSCVLDLKNKQVVAKLGMEEGLLEYTIKL